MVEWNICYHEHDGCGGLEEFFIVLPGVWKVAWWFLRKGRKCCEIYIWTSYKACDERGAFDDDP